jgi:hypothetical protein
MKVMNERSNLPAIFATLVLCTSALTFVFVTSPHGKQVMAASASEDAVTFEVAQVTAYKFKLKCKKGTQVLPKLLIRSDRPYMTMLSPKDNREMIERTFKIVFEGDDVPAGAPLIDSYVGPNGYFAQMYENTATQSKAESLPVIAPHPSGIKPPQKF